MGFLLLALIQRGVFDLHAPPQRVSLGWSLAWLAFGVALCVHGWRAGRKP